MTRPIAIVGAPSSIGIRPYDDGTPRRLDLAPGALRAQGLVTRLNARDDGDVLPPPYRELVRPPMAIRNAADVADYSGALAKRVAKAGSAGEFVLVLGGDCSIILGSLLGVSRSGPTGLVYADAHSDFATPDRSTTGSAAAMCLALAVGRGESPSRAWAALSRWSPGRTWRSSGAEITPDHSTTARTSWSASRSSTWITRP